MDHADMLLSLIAGNADAANIGAKDRLQSLGELPKMSKQTEERLASLGFEFPKDVQVSRPRLFRAVKMPEGWTIAPTGHYMYSDLLDPQGRKRGTIGLKIQDNWSDFYLVRRFTPGYTWDDPSDRHAPVVACILDSNGREVWRGKRFLSSLSEQARESALAKLNELAPKHDDVMEYWDAEIAWPPHETPPDTRLEYQINVELYRDGHRSDGGPHSTCRANTKEEAKEKLLRACGSLAATYEVRWTIFEIGTPADRKQVFVEHGVLYPPPMKPRMRVVGLNGHDYRLDETGRFRRDYQDE